MRSVMQSMGKWEPPHGGCGAPFQSMSSPCQQPQVPACTLPQDALHNSTTYPVFLGNAAHTVLTILIIAGNRVELHDLGVRMVTYGDEINDLRGDIDDLGDGTMR